MTEIFLYYNEKLLDFYNLENIDKAVRTLKKATKFEVIIDNDNGRYTFEVKLDDTDWKLKKGIILK